jgi:hypothetical protein
MTLDRQDDNLPREIQWQLVQAFESSDRAALRELMQQHPALVPEIADYMLALTALAEAEEAPEAEIDAAIARAVRTALATRSGPDSQPAMTLREAIVRAGARKAALARQLRLGVDVLNRLVEGAIDLKTVPERLFAELGEKLNATADIVLQWMRASQAGAQAQPALLRGEAQTPQAGASGPLVAFDDAVRASPNMTEDERTRWLGAH